MDVNRVYEATIVHCFNIKLSLVDAIDIEPKKISVRECLETNEDLNQMFKIERQMDAPMSTFDEALLIRYIVLCIS